jgi:hypothetical protein
MEIRNVHVAHVHAEANITQRFSKLNSHVRVTAYCRRFIYNFKQPKANRQTTTLSTQDLDKALACCVKMVQQTAYAQEVEELVKHQEVSVHSFLKALQPFTDQEGLLRFRGQLQQSALPYQTMHQMIWASNHHSTKLVVSVEHSRLLHAWPQLLRALLRER